MPDPIGTADAELLMKQSLSKLLLSNQFFAHLAMRMEFVPDETCSAGWTDGNVIAYNPAYVSALTPELRRSFIARFVLHVACGHMWRRHHREENKWSTACAMVVTSMLLEDRMPVTKDWPYDPKYATCSAEEVYRQLPDEPADNQWVRDAPLGGISQEEKQVQVLEAIHHAAKQGTLPKGLERLVNTITQPACKDLIAALLEFVSRRSNNDYTYTRPSRRGMQQGIYNPSLYSIECPPVVACVDTSGSVGHELLKTYVGALQRVLDECKPEYLVAISCDAAVHKVATFYFGDDIRGPFPGNGGTSFIPALQKAAEFEPSCVIYLTDLYGEFPEKAPEVPVLWVVADARGQRLTVPFGDVIYLE